jgi:hypothetical protein
MVIPLRHGNEKAACCAIADGLRKELEIIAGCYILRIPNQRSEQMNWNQLNKIAKSLGAFYEGGVWRFPSVWAKDEFERRTAKA